YIIKIKIIFFLGLDDPINRSLSGTGVFCRVHSVVFVAMGYLYNIIVENMNSMRNSRYEIYSF
ncbi:hypothetical protein L9F63_006586, partial [Diploptera punctata]